MEEIAFLTRTSERLVQDYLAIYEAAMAAPHRREKLEEELAKVSPSTTLRTGGGRPRPAEAKKKGGGET